MSFEMWRDYTIDCAHRLDRLPSFHKCHGLHGHTYRIRVWVRGGANDQGMVIEYSHLDQYVHPVLSLLDHKYLNDIDGLVISTVENLCMWIGMRVHKAYQPIFRVEVTEGNGAGCAWGPMK